MKRLYLKLIFLLIFLLSLLKSGNINAQCDSAISTTVLSRDTVLRANVNYPGNLIVDSNVTLTIYSQITFRRNASLIIKQGAKVYLHGATLTRDCNRTVWVGVQISGTKTRGQGTSSSPDVGQGFLSMDSNSIIEWASTGIHLENGGMVVVNNSTIKNCRKGAEFLAYINPSAPTQNVSIFDNCDFLMDDTLPSPAYTGTALNAFVTMDGVKGIWFRGVHFINTVPVSKITYNDPTYGRSLGYGIQSIDASYVLNAGGPYVTTSGCSAGQGRNCLFQGLTIGIEHNAINPQYTVNIIQTNFINIQWVSVLIYDSYNTTIRKCLFKWDTNFDVDSSASYLNDVYGINMIHSKGFDIDSNKIIMDLPMLTPYNRHPILIQNSFYQTSHIYSNNFQLIRDGGFAPTSAIQFSYAGETDGSHSLNSGMKVNCNVFSGFKYDIAIYENLYPYGVFSDQGSSTLDAGNKFSNCSTGNVRIISDYNIKYYTDLSDPSKYNSSCSSSYVHYINTSSANPCSPTNCLTQPR